MLLVTHADTDENVETPNPSHTYDGRQRAHDLANWLMLLDCGMGQFINPCLIISGSAIRNLEVAERIKKRFPLLPEIEINPVLGNETKFFRDAQGHQMAVLPDKRIVPAERVRTLRQMFPKRAFWDSMRGFRRRERKMKTGPLETDIILCCTSQWIHALGFAGNTLASIFTPDWDKEQLILLKQSRGQVPDYSGQSLPDPDITTAVLKILEPGSSDE